MPAPSNGFSVSLNRPATLDADERARLLHAADDRSACERLLAYLVIADGLTLARAVSLRREDVVGDTVIVTDKAGGRESRSPVVLHCCSRTPRGGAVDWDAAGDRTFRSPPYALRRTKPPARAGSPSGCRSAVGAPAGAWSSDRRGRLTLGQQAGAQKNVLSRNPAVRTSQPPISAMIRVIVESAGSGEGITELVVGVTAPAVDDIAGGCSEEVGTSSLLLPGG